MDSIGWKYVEDSNSSELLISIQYDISKSDEKYTKRVKKGSEQVVATNWDGTAKKAGLSQEQYDEGVKAFVTNAMAQLPNQDLEIQKLGDKGKDRVQAAEMWSKKHLSPVGYNNFARLAATAEGVKVIEELMNLNKDSTMPTTPTQVDVSASADDLKSMLNDPRYYDSSRRDPAYVKRVTELYEKAYKNTQK